LPYRHGNLIRVAAAWTRDNIAWELEGDVTSAKVEDLSKSGYDLVDIGVYSDPKNAAGSVSYCGVWAEQASSGAYRVVAGVESDDLFAEVDSLQASGYRPVTHSVVLTPLGTRFSVGIWELNELRDERSYFTWDEPQPDYFTDVSGLSVIHVLPSTEPVPLKQQFDRQFILANRVLKGKPDNLEGAFLQARASYYLGHYELIKRALARLISVAPKSLQPSIHAYRVWALARQGKESQVRRELERYRRLWIEPYLSLVAGKTLIFLGHHAAASKTIEALSDDLPDNPDTSFFAACVFSVASEAVATSDSKAAEHYTSRALELLRLWLEDPSSELARLQSTPDLAPLRKHPEFKALLGVQQQVPLYSAIWHEREDVDGRDLHGMSPDAHVQKSRHFIDAGFCPCAISVAACGEDLVASSVWQREAMSPAKRRLIERKASTLARIIHQCWATSRKSFSSREVQRSYLEHRAEAGNY
jgi:hypothetical protein